MAIGNEKKVEVVLSLKDQATGTLNKFDKGFVKKIAGWAAGIGAVAVAVRGLKFAADAAMTMERLRLTFETLYKDAARGNEALDAVSQFAANTPYQLQNVARSAAQLKAVGLGEEMETLTGWLKSAGNAAVIAGVDIEEVIRLISRIRMGAYGEAFQRMGEMAIASRRDLEMRGLKFDAGGSYKGSAEEALEAIKHIMDEKFGGMMDKMKNTAEGAVSNMKDALFQLGAAVGEQMTPIIKDMATAIGEMASDKQLVTGLRELVGLLAEVGRLSLWLVKILSNAGLLEWAKNARATGAMVMEEELSKRGINLYELQQQAVQYGVSIGGGGRIPTFAEAEAAIAARAAAGGAGGAAVGRIGGAGGAGMGRLPAWVSATDFGASMAAGRAGEFTPGFRTPGMPGLPPVGQLPQIEVEYFDFWDRMVAHVARSTDSMGVSAENFANTFSTGMWQTANELNNVFWGMRGDFGKIAKGMAQDFTRYFFQEILKQAASWFVPKFLSFFKFWDVRANDLAAQREGRELVRHIGLGAFTELRDLSLGPQLMSALTGHGWDGSSMPTLVPTVVIHNANPETWAEIHVDSITRAQENRSRERADYSMESA
jgi:hypothetical protein